MELCPYCLTGHLLRLQSPTLAWCPVCRVYVERQGAR